MGLNEREFQRLTGLTVAAAEAAGAQVGPKAVLPQPPPNTPPRGRASVDAREVAPFTVLWLPGWLPTSVNRLRGSHWSTGAGLKKADRTLIGYAALAHGCAKASKKRRVELLIVVPAGQRRFDDDNVWKSTLDALKHAGLLVNDSPNWCEHEKPRYARSIDGAPSGTMILLTDL